MQNSYPNHRLWCVPVVQNVLSLFYTNRLDLLFSIGLGFKRRRPNLDPGRFSGTRFDDFAFLRRFLLDDIVVGARRRHQQPYVRGL